MSNLASGVYGGTAFVNNFYYPSLDPTDSPAVYSDGDSPVPNDVVEEAVLSPDTQVCFLSWERQK